MARLGRYFIPDQPLHIIQRGNNRNTVFFGDDDFAHYRDWLIAAAEANGGWALGNERFRQEIAAMAKRRAAPLPKGPRPSSAPDSRQMTLL